MDIEPGQSWEVDLFRPEDALGVTGLFRLIYGNDYPIRTYLEPELLIAENAAKRVVSSVARTPKGDIVGHSAVFQSSPFAGIRESGSGVVHPAYRGGMGIFGRLLEHAQEVQDNYLHGEGLHGEPVCNHVFTQRATHKLGWRTMALEVDLMPAATYAQEKSAKGRVSTLINYKTFRPRPQLVYLPARYESQLRAMYANLDDTREFSRSQGEPPSGSQTRVVTQIFDFAQVARLAVHDAGADFEQVIMREEARAAERGVLVFQVWLKASQPWVGWVADKLWDNGHFLGGPLPRWFDDDGLLMQRVAHRPHWEQIELVFDEDKEVMRLVRQDWERLSSGRYT